MRNTNAKCYVENVSSYPIYINVIISSIFMSFARSSAPRSRTLSTPEQQLTLDL